MSTMSPMCSSFRRSTSGSPPPRRRASLEFKGRVRDGLMPCHRARARAQLSAKAGAQLESIPASPVGQIAAEDGKSRFSFSLTTINALTDARTAAQLRAAQRFSALADARNAHKQKVASEARARAFCKDMVVKLGEIKQTLRA